MEEDYFTSFWIFLTLLHLMFAAEFQDDYSEACASMVVTPVLLSEAFTFHSPKVLNCSVIHYDLNR